MDEGEGDEEAEAAFALSGRWTNPADDTFTVAPQTGIPCRTLPLSALVPADPNFEAVDSFMLLGLDLRQSRRYT